MAKCKYDWVAIRAYFEAGHTVTECGRRFGFHFTSWYKAIERGLIPQPAAHNRGQRQRYDWAAVQRYYDEGHSYMECRIRFGFYSRSWEDAVRRGAIRTRDPKWPIEKVLREAKDPNHVKTRLIAAGILENKCSQCGIIDWRSEPISIHMDHINGVNTDNRLENLRMLCPNCHSQTDTFGARNIKLRKNRSRIV
ncbi:MAG: HNH endonuclease signature motif containing protein [Vulcanimicrobiaceae bacterium]